MAGGAAWSAGAGPGAGTARPQRGAAPRHGAAGSGRGRTGALQHTLPTAVPQHGPAPRAAGVALHFRSGASSVTLSASQGRQSNSSQLAAQVNLITYAKKVC